MFYFICFSKILYYNPFQHVYGSQCVVSLGIPLTALSVLGNVTSNSQSKLKVTGFEDQRQSRAASLRAANSLQVTLVAELTNGISLSGCASENYVAVRNTTSFVTVLNLQNNKFSTKRVDGNLLLMKHDNMIF